MKFRFGDYKILIVLLSMSAMLQACLSNGKKSSGGDSNSIPSSTSIQTTIIDYDSSRNEDINISSVMPSGTAPGSLIDIISNTDLTKICTSTNSSNPPGQGPSTCSCFFEFEIQDSLLLTTLKEVRSIDTTLFESNLVRCRHDSIPNNASNIKVSIRAGSLFSNKLTFLKNSTGVILNPQDAASFVQAKRYQCRDLISIPYLFAGGQIDDPDIYDPFQSESPSVSFPLNFFHTNFGGTLLTFQKHSKSGARTFRWECDFNESDRLPWSDSRLYSKAGDLIQGFTPVQNARTTFHLARSKTGVFTVPVNSFVIPKLRTADNAQDPLEGPIGFGALPDQNAGGACPANAEKPFGFHFVKLWLFRADIPPRKFVSRSNSANLSQVVDVICNPGQFRGGQAFSGDCNASSKSLVNTPDGSGNLFARLVVANIAGSNPPMVCVSPEPGKGRDIAGDLNITSGTDAWTRSRGTNPTQADLTRNFGLNLGNPINPGQVYAPADNLTSTLSSIDVTSRSDFLFVVTPEKISIGNVEEQLTLSVFNDLVINEDPAIAKFIPIRVKRKSKCTDESGNALPSLGIAGCSTTESPDDFLFYSPLSLQGALDQIQLNDPIYPVCVLQPDGIPE